LFWTRALNEDALFKGTAVEGWSAGTKARALASIK
jgi:hypothetical protein